MSRAAHMILISIKRPLEVENDDSILTLSIFLQFAVASPPLPPFFSLSLSLLTKKISTKEECSPSRDLLSSDPGSDGLDPTRASPPPQVLTPAEGGWLWRRWRWRPLAPGF
jgi:hypothetical protein